MDITLVSIFPKKVTEVKPGLIPDTFEIPESNGKDPVVVHLKDARSHLYIRDGKTYPITHPAEEVANALVNDFVSSHLQADTEACPGMFWVEGKYSKADIPTKFPEKLAIARKKQNAWFLRLVRLADDDFAKTGQHRVVSDLQRLAASVLGLTSKPWYQPPEPIAFIKCPACSTMVEETAAICMNCKYPVNKELAAKLGIKV